MPELQRITHGTFLIGKGRKTRIYCIQKLIDLIVKKRPHAVLLRVLFQAAVSTFISCLANLEERHCAQECLLLKCKRRILKLVKIAFLRFWKRFLKIDHFFHHRLHKNNREIIWLFQEDLFNLCAQCIPTIFWNILQQFFQKVVVKKLRCLIQILRQKILQISAILVHNK